jgi:hypothetical protein
MKNYLQSNNQNLHNSRVRVNTPNGMLTATLTSEMIPMSGE